MSFFIPQTQPANRSFRHTIKVRIPTPVLIGLIFCTAAIRAESDDWPRSLISAARSQIGVTVRYDPSYQTLAYPGGDVSEDRGVCTDVLIRALRASLAVDLQKLIHEDMAERFSGYPQIWRLSEPDKSIDHRRVPNLQTFFSVHAETIADISHLEAFLPGDLVTSLLPGNLPHIMIVSDRMSKDGTPLVLHNIGRGTQEEDYLFRYPITAHYRLNPEILRGMQTRVRR